MQDDLPSLTAWLREQPAHVGRQACYDARLDGPWREALLDPDFNPPRWAAPLEPLNVVEVSRLAKACARAGWQPPAPTSPPLDTLAVDVRWDPSRLSGPALDFYQQATDYKAAIKLAELLLDAGYIRRVSRYDPENPLRYVSTYQFYLPHEKAA